LRQLHAAVAEADAALAATTAARRAAGAGIHCKVDAVAGDTTVRQFPLAADAVALADLPPKELRARLRGMGNAGKGVFSGADGAVNWTYRPTEAAQ
jgi:hypothetical protein